MKKSNYLGVVMFSMFLFNCGKLSESQNKKNEEKIDKNKAGKVVKNKKEKTSDKTKGVKDNKSKKDKNLNKKNRKTKEKVKISNNRNYTLYDHYRFSSYEEADPGSPIIINGYRYYYIYKGEKVIEYRKRGFEILVNERVVGLDFGLFKDCKAIGSIISKASEDVEYLKFTVKCFENISFPKIIQNHRSKNLMLYPTDYTDKSYLDKILPFVKRIKVLVSGSDCLNEQFFKQAVQLHTLDAYSAEPCSLKGIENSKSIRTLNIHSSMIQPEDYKKLATLKTLRKLIIGESETKGDSLNYIGSLTGLRYLDICGAKILKPQSFAFLEKLTELRTLKVCEFASKTAKYLKNLKNLKHFDMSKGTFTPELYSTLLNLKTLRILKINDLKEPKEEDYKAVGKLTWLKHLNAGGIRDSPSEFKIKHLGNLKNLEYLDLSETSKSGGTTNIDDNCVKNIAGLTNLKYLNLDGGRWITGKTISPKWSKLEYLNVELTKVEDEKWVKIISGFKNLKELNLYSYIKPVGYKHLNNLKNLKVLHMSSRWTKNREAFNSLNELKDLNNLIYLKILGFGVTGENLKGIGKLKNLKYLYLSIEEINNDGLIHLKNLKTLKYFTLSSRKKDKNSLKSLAFLTSLEKLRILSSYPSDSYMPYIFKLKNLFTLSLPKEEFTEKSLQFLGKMKQLQKLNFSPKNMQVSQKIALKSRLKNCFIDPPFVMPKKMGPFVIGEECEEFKEISFNNKKLGCGSVTVSKKEYFALIAKSKFSSTKIYNNKGKEITTFKNGGIMEVSIYKKNFLIIQYDKKVVSDIEYFAIVDLLNKKVIFGGKGGGSPFSKKDMYLARLELIEKKWLVTCVDLKKMKISIVHSFNPEKLDEAKLSWEKSGKLKLKGYDVNSDSDKTIEISCPKK
jgi:hypothetical protein